MAYNINSLLDSSDGRAKGWGFDPPLGQNSFSNNWELSIIRKRPMALPS